MRLLTLLFLCFETGALCTSLGPSALALAMYFIVADVTLILQCSYYNAVNARRRSRSERHARSARHASTETHETDTTAVEDPSEHDPLLDHDHHHQHSRRSRSDSTGLPGSHRRHSARRRESTLDPLTRIVTGEDETPDSNPWLHNAIAVLAVWVVGVVGWFISYKMGAWNVEDGSPEDVDKTVSSVLGMILGYFSALCYLWYVSYPAVSAHSPDVTARLRRLTKGIALGFLKSSRTTVKSLARASLCCSSCSRSRAT